MQSLATKSLVVVLVGSSLLPYAVIVKQDSIQSVDLLSEAVTESSFWNVNSIGQCSWKLSYIIGRELMRSVYVGAYYIHCKKLLMSDLPYKTTALLDRC